MRAATLALGRVLARTGARPLAARGRAAYSTLLTECSSAGVLQVTLNRPDALNAFSPEMRD